MDHFSYLIDGQHRLLLIGIVLLITTALFALSGGAFEPHSGIVYRAKEPRRFWWNVVGYFLGGLFFIGVYFVQNSN
jgi:energy-coupling factor transporter transmembrane protein EcfT